MPDTTANTTAGTALRRSPALPESAWLRPLPAAARIIFCADTAARAAAWSALNLPACETTCRAVSNADYAALWLGPDERLLLAAADQLPKLLQTLQAALASLPHSVVDISHRQAAFELQGPHAAWLLNAQCPLDLSLAAFPVGMCTRSVFAKVELVLWRTAASTFRVEVGRSFADYLTSMLQDVARELPQG